MMKYHWSGKRYNVSAGTYGTEVTLHPIYGESVSIKHSMPDTERYYKESFNGTLKFVRDDYDWIMATVSSVTPFDTIYEISLIADNGDQMTVAMTLKFTITDCTINTDDRVITVKPTAKTRYDDVLNGLDREFNLIDLNPVIEQVQWNRRAVLQIYHAGDDTITDILGTSHWEETVEDPTAIDADLTNNFHFALAYAFNEITVTGSNTAVNGTYIGEINIVNRASYYYNLYPLTANGYYIKVTAQDNGITINMQFELKSTTSPYNTLYHDEYSGAIVDQFNNDRTWYDGGDNPTGSKFNMRQTRVYSRILTGKWIQGTTSIRGTSDLSPYSKNLPYCAPNTSVNIEYSLLVTTSPNQYGSFEYEGNTLYYTPPTGPWEQYIPVSQSTWGTGTSFWYNFVSGYFNDTMLQKTMTLRHAYPLWSVIKVLLAEIAPDINFDATPDYSKFLFDYDDSTHPITQFMPRLFLTPKSNILNGDYQTPAYNAPVKLKDIFEMLKAVYKCYWYIDTSNNLHIEHVKYFMNGGTYGTPSQTVSYDLTQLLNTRNGKTWAFNKNTYTFDKPNMAATVTYKWMDDVSQEFTGYQMEMLSCFVEKGKNEEIAVGNFTTDLDFVTITPEDISKDGFMLLGADVDNGEYVVPFYPYRPDNTLPINYLQNGFLAMAYLETTFLLYNLPAASVEFADGTTASVVKQSRTRHQDVVVPMTTPIFDPITLIKTGLGEGEVQEIDINLSSLTAKAKLRYDTQQ